jgi:SAM-dependent methyltransferase
MTRQVDYAGRARYYEVEYQAKNDQLFLRSLVTDRVRAILEIPCGTGRSLGWLAETGREIVLADLEPEMVRRAQERVRQLGVTGRVRCVVADLRTIHLGRRFDLVLVPQEAFQLLSGTVDAVAALSQLRRHLRPGGTLVVDLHSFAADPHAEPDAALDYFDPGQPDGVMIPEWTRPVADGQLTRQRTQWQRGSTVRIGYSYTLRGPDGTAADSWQSEVVLRRYRLPEFSALATRAGLRVRQVLRNYAGHPYLPGSARAVVLLATDAGGSPDG